MASPPVTATVIYRVIQFSKKLQSLDHGKKVIWISLFAVIGVVTVLFAHAATSTSSIEPETNTIGGVATKVNDVTASGGQAVQFGTTATTGGVLSIAVSGKNFVDAKGAVVRLHGANRSGTEYACAQGWGLSDGPLDTASVDAMVPWHINAVRVPLNEQCWLGINGLPATSGLTASSYQQAITDYVNLLVSKNIYPILDLHWTHDGTIRSTAQQDMPDRDHAPAFWTSVATTFKANPAVILDVFNEPYPDGNSGSTAAWTCWRNGGSCPGFSYTAAGMQELVTAVRNTGASNVILLGGLQYAGNTSQMNTYKPSDPLNQLAASQHTYDNQYKFCVTTACWDANYTGVGNMPYVAGELGDGYCTPDYPNAYMAWADAKGSSYLGWAWNVSDCSGFPAVVTSYDGTPTAFGAAFKQHYQQQFP